MTSSIRFAAQFFIRNPHLKPLHSTQPFAYTRTLTYHHESEKNMRNLSTPYHSLCTEFYALDKPKPPADGLAYYSHLAKKSRGPILEPMCGSGRYLLPMRKMGLDVTGFDTSKEMIKLGRDICDTEQDALAMVEASFETFKPSTTYQLVFIPSGSFCLLTSDSDRDTALNTIFHNLGSNGTLAFEVDTLACAQNLEPTWTGNSVLKSDGSRILLSTYNEFEPSTNIMTTLCRYEHWENNRIVQTQVEDFRVRLYDPATLIDVLKHHGFKVNAISTPFSKDEIDKNTETVLVECTKK